MKDKTSKPVGIPRKFGFQKLLQGSILLLLVALCVFGSIYRPAFFTWYNLVDNISTNAAALAVIALGMTFVMIAGGFDLSVASTTVVCTIVLAHTINALTPCGAGVAIAGGLAAAAITGTLLGTVNGVLISYVGVNPFVVTLSTMLIFRGFALIISGGGQSLQIADLALREKFTQLMFDAQFPIFGQGHQIAIPIFFFGVVFCIGIYLLKFTRFGHYVYAVGGNEEAAWLAGVNTHLVKASTYAVCGLTCAVAATIFLANATTAEAGSHQGLELDVIASVIVGGTPLGGGSGGLAATVVGVMLLKVIENLLTHFGIGPEYRYIVTGFIIVSVVIVDVLAKKRGRV